MKTRFFSLLIVALVAINNSFAASNMGNPEFIAAFTEANKLMEEKFWDQAAKEWRNVLALDKENINVNFKLGYCLLQTENNKVDALAYLEKATSKKLNPSYDPFDPNERGVPVEALYYLGIAQHLNMLFDQSTDTFEVMKELVNKEHRLTNQINRAIETNKEAKKQVAKPKSYKITNAGKILNSSFADFGPVLTFDESSIFFTSRRLRPDSTNANIRDFETDKYRDDIYVSFKGRDGNWVQPELLNLNSDDHDATISVSPDGNTLFVYQDSLGDGQVKYSMLIGETWSAPVKLGSDINSKYWETHCTISADGNELYFVSDRPNGQGKRDIYRCNKNANGTWGKSENLGGVINTAYDEDAPFLSPDGSFLYFASKGHSTMGGFDLFVSKKDGQGNWGAPENMGYPLNTVDDDVFFQPLADGKRAYYSSRRDGGNGDLDIYEVEMPKAKGSQLATLKGLFIPVAGSPLPEGLKVVIVNSKTGEKQESLGNSGNGEFLAVIKPCADYRVDYYDGLDKIMTENISVPCEGESVIYAREVKLVKKEIVKIDEIKIDKENPIQAKFDETQGSAEYSFYFLYGQSGFSAGQKQFIDFVSMCEKIIDKKGSVTITIEGSSSNVPMTGAKTNEMLAEERTEKAKVALNAALQKRGFVVNKDYKFGKLKSVVQGKKYENDAIDNRTEYEKNQYIKIIVQ
jgi:tetratricopeptide (TPR) repeat protein